MIRFRTREFRRKASFSFSTSLKWDTVQTKVTDIRYLCPLLTKAHSMISFDKDFELACILYSRIFWFLPIDLFRATENLRGFWAAAMGNGCPGEVTGRVWVCGDSVRSRIKAQRLGRLAQCIHHDLSEGPHKQIQPPWVDHRVNQVFSELSFGAEIPLWKCEVGKSLLLALRPPVWVCNAAWNVFVLSRPVFISKDRDIS